MNKNIFSLAILSGLIIIGAAPDLYSQSAATSSTDERSAIALSATERDLVLKEMRAFLISVQQVSKAIVEDDMELAARSARKSGMAAQGAVPLSLREKLPAAFKKLGADTHSKFDLLALDAESLADGEHALEQLATLMENCVSCHEVYRFVAQ